MGFCQLALFGGYAIYFPELFPTRLRSTGISFCYNVGPLRRRHRSARPGIPVAIIFETGRRRRRAGFPHAGLTMCSIFLLGLLVLPFAPETKGQPLPE